MSSDEPPLAGPPYQPHPDRRVLPKRLPAIGLIAALGIVSFLYRAMVLGRLEQSGAMFIGLPMILAMLLTLTPTSRTVTGTIMKGITLFLLIVGILLIEGFICILMASPLFYTVGLIVGIVADRIRVRKDMERLRAIAIVPLALMSLEGVTEGLSFRRSEEVTVTRQTPLSPDRAANLLAGGPTFDLKELPPFLKLGFPRPVAIHGTGLKEGDTWTIRFAGGEGNPGDLSARVSVSEPGHYVVTAVSDTSHISHWMDWQEAEWHIEPSGSGSVVRLTMRYKRLLDPAWYFGPAERFGVRKAGEYFLQQTYGKP